MSLESLIFLNLILPQKELLPIWTHTSTYVAYNELNFGK